MNFGLCCLLYNEPLKYKSFTWKYLCSLDEHKALDKINTVWNHNIKTLQDIIYYCRDNKISSYRITSNLFPQFDRVLPILGDKIYEFSEKLKDINDCGVKLSMHPGQFLHLGSPNDDVVENSINDLKVHFFMARPLNCTELNIHGGGSYGDIESSKNRFIKNFQSNLTEEEQTWITLENDELSYDYDDILDLAVKLGIRATLDLHHLKCSDIKFGKNANPSEVLLKFRDTWKGYNYQRVHISSPKNGYSTPSKSRAHHDYINELPLCLQDFSDLEIDVEAKAKELAIFNLM